MNRILTWLGVVVALFVLIADVAGMHVDHELAILAASVVMIGAGSATGL